MKKVLDISCWGRYAFNMTTMLTVYCKIACKDVVVIASKIQEAGSSKGFSGFSFSGRNFHTKSIRVLPDASSRHCETDRVTMAEDWDYRIPTALEVCFKALRIPATEAINHNTEHLHLKISPEDKCQTVNCNRLFVHTSFEPLGFLQVKCLELNG